MRLLTQAQSQELDRRSIAEFDLQAEELMENAAEAVKKAILENTPSSPQKALFLIGPGNNGADGWLVLIKLHKALTGQGLPPQFRVYCPQVGNGELWKKHKAKADLLGFHIVTEHELLYREWHEGVIIDAVYGTGLRRDVPELWVKAFRRLRRAKAFTLSVDLPSGLDPDRGIPRGQAFRAQMTITFGAAKPGLLMMEGPAHAGKVRIAPLIYPKELLREVANTHSAFGQRRAERALPSRPLTGHKGSFGNVVLMCGSPEFRGAGILAGEAALRVGTGYVYIVADNDVYPEMLRLPEAIYLKHDDFFTRDFDVQKSVFVVGPGLVDSEFIGRVIRDLLEKKAPKVILDAEALNDLPQLNLPRPLPPGWILTPHPGELSRLTGQSAVSINEDRCKAAKHAQIKWGGVVVLKGFRTVIAAAEGKLTILLSGNSALAKAGSGDVLAGLMAGIYAQMDDAAEAAGLACYVHGRIASWHVRSGGDPASLIPSDLIQQIDPTLGELRRARKSRR
jgi:hydroxyethylthiazole kinase-like uncharacterized protein yjeF